MPGSGNISEKVLNRLEESILNGEYPPGGKLLEREIAVNLGVSRAPVREALQTLEKWGLVKRLNTGGKIRVVAHRKRENVIAAYTFRSMLECQALSWQSLSGNLELADILKNLVEKMDELAVTGDIEGYRRTNAEFHFEMIQSTGNNRLSDVYMEVNRMIRWYRARTLYKPRMKSSNEEHKKMIRLYKEKDLTGIHLLFMKHHKHAAEIIAAGIAESEDSEDSRYNQMKRILLKFNAEP